MVFAVSSHAQDKVVINGKIINKANHEPVPFVHIIDKNKGTGVSSDVNGEFKIKITPGDTLLFSAVGYNTHSLVITEQLEEVNITIKLDEKAMELNAVNVFAYKDLASLKRAIVDMDVPVNESEQIALNLPPVSYNPEGGGVIMSGGLTALINGLGLNKAYKQQKKLEEFKKEADFQKVIREKYNEKIVSEWTGLEKEEVRSFIEFCKLPDTFIFKASEYELAVAVNRCLKEYKKPE